MPIYRDDFMALKDLLGQRFGRLIVMKRVANNKWNDAMWECICDCGNKTITRGQSLRVGYCKSCGCLNKEMVALHTASSNRVHGHGGRKNRHPLYNIWGNLKFRCQNPNSKCYSKYGGRGITICSEWANDFVIFFNFALSNGWEKGFHTHRIDNNKGYYPDNVEFLSVQKHNQKHKTIRRQLCSEE